ncbi:putative DNA-binding transcriptional regulator [Yersinia kristensenii]|uniref:DNA-binding protein n=1 Tax=Yersinia kristensenii TaxID=28152 RepID=UPI000B6A6EAE|nr:DNA-binding protein [Yersinia kristensenii]MBW5811598.1 putative DNA-binding transcriptional regulator [Yersinia kristensenii]MBW5826644.1 putative DNA-binding transcriptional regulator [Yersinia kristensenii]MBW5828860.1 putative DNA-binding transcriptional regulator [Yersinia kristensenii]OWF83613.1 DNA-binding protein [Yersinia kristensenii]
MKKEWFAAKELAGLDGLPSSPQGVNLMAKREGWEQRRRRGVQGKAIEYHIESLPVTILNSLQLREEPAQYTATRQDPLVLWVEAYYRFTVAEREQVIAFIFREGAKSLIERLTIDERG